MLITDLQGRIIFCNGAFYQFASSPDEKTSVFKSEEIIAQQKKQEKIWAEILVKVPAGLSQLSSSKLPRGFTSWEIRRVPIQTDAGQNSDTLYLDILHLRNYSPVSNADLQNINGLVCELANFTSFFAYGSEEKRDEYVENLDKTTDKLEHMVK
ncbi:MAG TPA: hypothetical protein VK400_13445 [Pyrinomonadaceae bacterium]|nr:hypothetical protein [Pyrinomonadaceae bacterium]